MIGSADSFENNSGSKTIWTVAYIGWLSIALFYFYQYILRVAPGVLVIDLRRDFQLTAEQFSTLGAFYLYAYSLCQIPIGIIVDCVGIRKTVLSSITLCLSGALLLAYAPSLWMLQLSRVLVGIGSACAFMCALKMVVDYLPMGKRGFLMGATLTLGTAGALLAGKPLVVLSNATGWRTSIDYIALLGVIIIIVAFFALPKPRKESLLPASQVSPAKIGRNLLAVLKSRPVMLYAILAVSLYTPLSVLADLWGVSFLMQKYALSQAEAAKVSMMMYLGLGLGCLVLPYLSEKHQVLNRNIRYCAFGVLTVFALLLYGPALSTVSLSLLLVLLGVFCGAEMLCFAGAGQYTHSYNVGITLGVVNTLNMLGGGLLQQLIGFALDKLWRGRVDTFGVRLYGTHDYTVALSVLTLVICLCCILSLFLPKDKRVPD